MIFINFKPHIFVFGSSVGRIVLEKLLIQENLRFVRGQVVIRNEFSDPLNLRNDTHITNTDIFNHQPLLHYVLQFTE